MYILCVECWSIKIKLIFGKLVWSNLFVCKLNIVLKDWKFIKIMFMYGVVIIFWNFLGLIILNKNMYVIL